VDHAIRTQEGFLPGFRADETRPDEEMYGLSDQVIEALNGNLDRLLRVQSNGFLGGRVLADGGEPVTQAPFGGKDAVLEAKIFDIVSSANGTLLNDQRLTPHQPYLLKKGDKLQLGALQMMIEFGALEKE